MAYDCSILKNGTVIVGLVLVSKSLNPNWILKLVFFILINGGWLFISSPSLSFVFPILMHIIVWHQFYGAFCQWALAQLALAPLIGAGWGCGFKTHWVWVVTYQWNKNLWSFFLHWTPLSLFKEVQMFKFLV